MKKVIYVNDELKAVDELTDSDKQTIATRLVDREIHYCASHLISELSQDPHCTYIDDILEFSIKYEDLDPEDVCKLENWYTFEEYKNSKKYNEEDLLNELENYEIDPSEKQNLFYQVTSNGIIDILDCDLDWLELCYYNGYLLDNDDPIEAYEHWIVSDWLQSKLDQYGQLTTDNFLGLTIWGRTTTGQAICLDHVIQQIAIETYSFDQPK